MKAFITSLLRNNTIGNIVSFLYAGKVPNIRWPGFRFSFPAKYSTKTIVSAVYWGFYESAELRLIEKYLNPNQQVIELGGSLGIISSHVKRKLSTNIPYTIIEANPFLIDTIKQNLEFNNPNIENLSIINKALKYGLDKISFQISSNNTESKVNSGKSDSNTVLVNTTTLSQITALNSDPFTLICDIEGMEIEIIKNDKIGFRNCKALFIELHSTKYHKINYTVENLESMLINELNFCLVERDGNVFYFTKPQI